MSVMNIVIKAFYLFVMLTVLLCLLLCSTTRNVFLAVFLALSFSVLLVNSQKKELLLYLSAVSLLFFAVIDKFSNLNVFPVSLFCAFFFAYVIKRFQFETKSFFYLAKCAILLSTTTLLIYDSCVIPLFFSSKEPNRAIWVKSKWGVPIQHSQRLNITSQYSYDLLQNFLEAKPVADTKRLNLYDELWVITPTVPFKSSEKQQIAEWIKRGGRLVLITDHTDLFGHAVVSNDLLAYITNLDVQKNVILSDSNDGGNFYCILGRLCGLSANSFIGRGEPWMFTPGFSERTDYSERSFFSDNQISDEEKRGLFPVALNTPCKAGVVTVLGDSTSFANFALSRPSCQTLLKLTIRGGGVSIFAICATLMLGCLLRYTCTQAAALTASVVLCAYLGCRQCRPLNLANVQTCQISGDWSLIEGNMAPLASAFSTAYIFSNEFPLWDNKKTEDSSLQVHGRRIDFTFLRDKKSHNHTGKLATILQRVPLIESFKRDRNSCDFSQASFWYDDGIGPIRETDSKLFWNTLGLAPLPPALALGPSKKSKYICKMRNAASMGVTATITPLVDNLGWVLVGDYFLGKLISEEKILVRSIWQSAPIPEGDFVLIPDEQN